MSEIPGKIRDLIKRNNIRYIRFMWCDHSGVIGAKAVYIDNLHHPEYRSITFPKPGKPVIKTQSGYTFPVSYFCHGDVLLRPDWSTFNIVPYAAGHAKVFCYLYEGETAWKNCPRDFLDRMIRKASKYGLSFKFSFENEFYLLRQTSEGFLPVDNSIFGQTYPLDKYANLFSEITDALRAQGIMSETLHAESGTGQFELSVKYKDAIAAADQQVTFRETIRAIVQRQDSMEVSFLPKPFTSQAGSGTHIHLSIWRNHKNITANTGRNSEISDISKSFIAGLLHHARSLLCLTSPSINSYRRFLSNSWSGSIITWGYGDRDAIIRIPRASDNAQVTNIEYKPSDATSNPYLALGAIIASGLHGIEEHMEINAKMNGHSETISSWGRKQGKSESLPGTLGEAISYFRDDTSLKDSLGKDLFETILTLREMDWNNNKGRSHKQEVLLLNNRY